MFGQKLRLNVVALISEATVGRLLVCIDEESLVEDLSSKISNALVRSAIEGRLLRLTNHTGANLPPDEKVGDVLRDAEEVIAVLVSEPGDASVRQRLDGGVGELMSFARAPTSGHAVVGGQPAIPANVAGGGPRLQPMQQESFGSTALPPASPNGASHRAASPQGSPRMSAAPYPASKHRSNIPGPSEVFEEDLEVAPISKDLVDSMFSRLPAGSDWTVEGLTPKLREYISTRFREAHSKVAEPHNSFIAVTMRPRARTGAVPCQPIHYSIARIDIVEFERLTALKVQETRTRADHFRRCQQALQSLLDRGAACIDYAPNLIPYRYRDGEEISSLLSEADMPTFGHVEGFRPTILIDNSGAVGETLILLRSALKRILYSFLVAKSKFNVLKFSPQGNPVAWANGMVPPTAQVLREAEDFIDSIYPVRNSNGSNLMEGIQMALAHPEADTVYVLTSGLPKRCSLENALRSLRQTNVRDVPVHVLGVECEPKAELELRRLAEDNHGSFRHKRFGKASHSTLSSSMGSSDLNAGLTGVVSSDCEDGRLTINGQLSILEVMLDEQERHTVDWLEEQKCANRLLLTTASQQPVPDGEQFREMQQRSALREDRKLMGEGPSRLQELVEMHRARSPSPFPSPGGAGYAAPGMERRHAAARAERRAASLPRGNGAAAAEAIRRPSVVNPWDRPGGVIKASQLIDKAVRPPGCVPLPRPRSNRPGSARARPSSGTRADSARSRNL